MKAPTKDRQCRKRDVTFPTINHIKKEEIVEWFIPFSTHSYHQSHLKAVKKKTILDFLIHCYGKFHSPLHVDYS